MTGPKELPTILKMTVIPRDIPPNCLGVDSKIIFMLPTCNKDIPAAMNARFAETKDPVE
jgi:hypothetical protein